MSCRLTNSADLSIVDYAIWNATGASLTRQEVRHVDRLKQAIALHLRALPQRFIGHTIG